MSSASLDRHFRFLIDDGLVDSIDLVTMYRGGESRSRSIDRSMVGLLILINMFLGGPGDPDGVLIFGSFLFPMLAVFMVGEVTLRGKETLFIHKKTPSGVGRLVKARFLQGWLVVVPIAAAITAVSTVLIPQTTFIDLLTNTGFAVLFSTANVAFALGLSLLNPAFSEKSVRLWLNIIITVFSSIGLFLVSLVALSGILRLTADIWYILLLHAALSWVVGAMFLYLGKGRLGRIE